ncbi:hypothetical protein K1719_008182 [Acacia pycnantha]|nr:hypothetical protein K1719_008182 [Acacia pycnantha]
MWSENRRYIRWLVQLLAAAATYHLQTCVRGEPQVPCFFIFGDSLSDNGNNNLLPTAIKVNYFPYGIDFPGGATGRFSNNLTVPDYITKFVGINPLIPPFANTSGSDILKGVNYASGAAGILPETGTQYGVDISLESQITNHRVTVARITGRLGSIEAAQQYLHSCLYYVNIGGNDYLNNYFKPQYYPSSHILNLTTFTDVLITIYSRQLRNLYELGARKVTVVGVGQIGCLPSQISQNGSCAQEENKAASLFDSKLRSLVSQFNSQFSGDTASFIFVNATAITTLNPHFLGLKFQRVPCCRKLVSFIGLCVKNDKPCEDREEYVFMDGFHNTDAANRITALSAYNASNPSFTYPMDINHLLSSSP